MWTHTQGCGSCFEFKLSQLHCKLGAPQCVIRSPSKMAEIICARIGLSVQGVFIAYMQRLFQSKNKTALSVIFTSICIDVWEKFSLKVEVSSILPAQVIQCMKETKVGIRILSFAYIDVEHPYWSSMTLTKRSVEILRFTLKWIKPLFWIQKRHERGLIVNKEEEFNVKKYSSRRQHWFGRS